jgi:hypothetical protein
MGIAQSSELMIEWVSSDNKAEVLFVHFIGPRIANDGAWEQFLADLKAGRVSSISHVRLSIEGGIPTLLYTPNPQRIESLLKSIEANVPVAPGTVDLQKLRFSSNVVLSEVGLKQIEAAKKRAQSLFSGNRNEGDSGALTGDAGEIIAAEFAEKITLGEKTGLKTVTKLKAGEKYMDTAIYPLDAEGFVVTFQPHTGVSDWTNSKPDPQRMDALRIALKSHSESGAPYKVVAILNLDDKDFEREPLASDYLLDKVEEFLDKNKLKGPAVINVLTPGFDLGQRVTYSERPRTMSIQVAWSPSLYKIIE